jgi:hypothetical protein
MVASVVKELHSIALAITAAYPGKATMIAFGFTTNSNFVTATTMAVSITSSDFANATSST